MKSHFGLWQAVSVLRRPTEQRSSLQSPVGTPTGQGDVLPVENIKLAPVEPTGVPTGEANPVASWEGRATAGGWVLPPR